jgi:hypothetical protein
MHTGHETVMLGDPTQERVLGHGSRGPAAPTGQIDEAVKIRLPRDQRSQDSAAVGTGDDPVSLTLASLIILWMRCV